MAPPEVAAWRKALSGAREGTSLDVEVVPGASESRFPAGFNEWRGVLTARLRAPPEKGKANEELVALVAERLGVPAAQVRITSGATSRRKRLIVEGLTPNAVASRLAPHLETAR